MPAPPVLERVAVYRRRVAGPLARVWENVRDWEHLPWLHAASFRAIALEAEGDWGWRARIGLPPAPDGPTILLELRVDDDARGYLARTLAGPGAGGEIRTRLAAARGGAATDVEVEFWLPDVAPASAAALGAAYTALYRRLWDEDEAMIVRRTELLASADAPAAEDGPLPLGPLADPRTRLPRCVAWRGARWRVLELDGALVAHAARCPHRGGPLDEAPLAADGTVTCPWHGWRFDARSGRSADGRGARLPAARVRVDADGTAHLVPAAS